MELHPSKVTSLLLLWGVFCVCVMCMRVQGDAMVAQTCSTQTSQPCQAMIGYVPPSNFDLSEIASLFSLNYTSLLGPNDIDPSLPNLSELVLLANYPYSIPQTCGCVNDKRVVTSANYTVVAGNTLILIASTLYSGLVTYEEIAAVNGVPNPDLIDIGQVFMIPIPCACANQSDATQPSMFLSYQIQTGDSLSTIAEAHSTTAARLQQLNSLPGTSVTANDVLFIPLSVCKANFSTDALDKDLTVLEGKYELTANSCVQCNCINGTLHCIRAPSSLGGSCSNITCPGSSLALGSSTASQGNGECTVRSCVYKGYTARSGINATLEIEEDLSCPIALAPETFFKPPPDLVASPLPTMPAITSPTPPSPPPSSTTTATPPTPTTSNHNSASILLAKFGFSWWWSLLLAGLLL